MTKPCTIDPDKPCQGCMLRGTSLKAKVSGSLNARFLVVTNPPTEKRLVDKENMTKGGMQVFAANMEKCGFDAQDFMFMPYIRCHFDEDQLTTREKADIRKHCVHWLAQTAEHFNPEVIIPLGVEPSKAVYGRGVKLGKIRGIADHVEGFDQLVMTLTDPGSIFFRPEHEPIFASDCRTLERLVKYDYDKEAAAEQVLGEYETVTDLQFLIDNPPEVLAFDTETTGLRWYEPNKILTMQFTTAPGNGYMVVWDHPDKPFPRRLRKKLKQQLKQVLQNPNTSVVGQNLKFDALFVWRHFGFRFRIDDDTLMLAAIVDENAQTKDLDTLTKLYAPEMAGYADAFNAKWDKSRMDLVPLDELEGYGCGDTDACLRVYYALMSIVDQDEGLYQTYRRVSIPGINAFYSIETRGLNVDEAALDDLEVVLTESVREQNISLMSRVDKAIKRKHITSAKDPKDRAKAVSWSRKAFMIDVLFDHPKGFLLKPSVFTDKTKNLADQSRRVPSCSSKEHLPYFFEEESFTEELAAYVKDERLLSTNVVSFRNKYIHRGKVYPSYSLGKAVTGRTASCVKNDTPVVTQRGVVPADSVVVGDMVWTHMLRWLPVLDLYIKPVTLMYSLHLSNGEVLTCTGQHRVMLRSGRWRTVDSLRESAVSAGLYDGGYRGTTIEKIEPAGVHPVYDFEVAQDHSYLACGIFNHNSDPNGQNFPKRGKLAKAYRKIFVPPPGRYMLEADLSQAELRFAAESANEKVMLEIYQNGGDIHTITAAVTMGIDPDVVMRAKKDYTTLLADVADDWPGAGMYLRSMTPEKAATAVLAAFIGFKRTQAKAINFGFCIAEGQKVLTDAGLVPIEDIKDWHLVWDGVEWVSHKGLVYRGEQEVIEYDGIVATPEHEVFTEDGHKVQIGKLASSLEERRIAVSADQTKAVRFFGPDWADREEEKEPSVYRDGLLSVSTESFYSGGQFVIREDYKLQMPEKTKVPVGSESQDTWSKIRCYGAEMYEVDACKFEELRRARDQSVVHIQTTFHRVGFREVPGGDIQGSRLRQDEQRRALLTREFETCHTVRKFNEPSETKSTAKVYDLLDAGPRRRFTVEGKLVSNCYGMGWRKFIGYAKTQYGIEFTEAEAQETRRVFFQTYPGLAPWHDRVRAFAKKNKYVRSFSGRVRHLPMIDSQDEMIAGEASRQAVNSPIQEFASSLGVMSAGRIDAGVDPEYMALTAFVHDALYAYCWPQHIEWAAKTMKYYMESNPLKDWFGLKLRVPIIADVGFGLNGGETHEMGDLELDKPFDFDSIPQLDIDVPEQVIPPNNGRIIQPKHLHIRY